MEAFHNPTQYMINTHYETTMNKLADIQTFLVSLVDRILHVVADINLRLNYVMELCLRLTENPKYPDFSQSRSKTPVPEKQKEK